jgi:hypothetical protein
VGIEVGEALACGLVVPRVQPTLEGTAQRFARRREGVPRPPRLEFDHTDEIGSTVAVAVRVGDRLRNWPQPRTPSPKQPHTVVLPLDERRHNKTIDHQSAIWGSVARRTQVQGFGDPLLVVWARSRRYVWIRKRRSEVFGHCAGGLPDVAALKRFDYRQMAL